MNLFIKELLSLYKSVGFYLLGFIFLVGSALFLFFFSGNFNIFELNQANLYPFFQIAPYFLIILLPAMTMKSFAEEQEKETLDWLKTMPVDMSKIVAAKFLSIFSGLFTFIFLSLTFFFIVQHFSLNGIDSGLLFSSYLGLIFLGIFIISVGIFSSAISSNQILAYILAVLINAFFYFFISGLADYNLIGSLDYLTQSLSVKFHYERFTQGIFYLSSCSYFIGFSFLFIFLAHQKLNQK